MPGDAHDELLRHAGDRWLLIAAATRGAGVALLRECGIAPRLVLERQDLLCSPRKLRRLLTEHGIERVALHSADWRRQRMPQLFEITSFVIADYPTYLIDEGERSVRSIRGADLLGAIARSPLDVLEASACSAYSVASVFAARRTAGPARSAIRPMAANAQTGSQAAVLAIWLGDPSANVGGSVTHISGILAGFRRIGLRVGLVTMHRPPAQLAAVVDDLEMTEPPPRGKRLLKEIEWIAANGLVRSAAARLSRRLRPAFVYQRHHPFLCAGLDVAASAQVPFVLEWNGSEAWFRRWYEATGSVRVFGGPVVADVIASLERRVVVNATLIVAVSRPAADGARDIGASSSSVLIVPNGVDVAEVRSVTQTATARRGRGGVEVGWIGSFGAWHGAEVLVRAASQVPDEVKTVMIGDGPERSSCEGLAAALGARDRIQWLGALEHDVALRRLAECDILVSPHVPFQSDEPFFGSPTKLYEYMAIGRPIVASRLDQIDDVLDDGRTARLVAPGDPSALAEAIMEVAGLPDRGQSLGDAAQSEAEASHDWEHRAAAILGGLRRAPLVRPAQSPCRAREMAR